MNAIISMVEKTKEKSTEKVHFIVRAIFVTQRIKRVVQPQDRQKVRDNMQIVIKMPEEMYRWIHDANKFSNDYGTGDFIDLIKNGTPLPKDHGNLVDYEELKNNASEYSAYATETVSLAVFEQVKWERDVAIQQLEELGYGFAEKIRTDEDCISRKAVLDLAKKGVLVSNGNYKAVCKAINELPSVKPKDDVSGII